MADSDLGTVGSWVRDGAVGNALLTGQFIVLAVAYQHVSDPTAAVRVLTTPSNLYQGALVGSIGALVGGLVAVVAWPATRVFHHVHPALAFLGGPPIGFAVTALTVLGAAAVLDDPMNIRIDTIQWGRVGILGGGVAVFAWPIYVVLRSRGRSGWPAGVVAAFCMFAPIAVLAWT